MASRPQFTLTGLLFVFVSFAITLRLCKRVDPDVALVVDHVVRVASASVDNPDDRRRDNAPLLVVLVRVSRDSYSRCDLLIGSCSATMQRLISRQAWPCRSRAEIVSACSS